MAVGGQCLKPESLCIIMKIVVIMYHRLKINDLQVCLNLCQQLEIVKHVLISCTRADINVVANKKLKDQNLLSEVFPYLILELL